MSYLFNGTSSEVVFAQGPFSGYTLDAYTYAMLLQRDSVVASTRIPFAFAQSNGNDRWHHRILSNNAHDIESSNGNSGSPAGQALSSTAPWYLAAVTRAAGASVTPRFHLWDGSTWSHANPATAVGQVAIQGTDTFKVGVKLNTSWFWGKIVCAGLKKANSNDAAVETLSPTSFIPWIAFAFDWLVGFQAIGTIVNRTSPGSGDETARANVSVAADPPGWVWSAFVPQTVVYSS